MNSGEREADTGEDLTQGVSESLASTTLVTLVNTWYDTRSFWFHPYAPELLCGETLAPLENIPDYRSTASTGARSG